MFFLTCFYAQAQLTVLLSYEAQFLRLRNLVRRHMENIHLKDQGSMRKTLLWILEKYGCGGVKQLKLAYSCVK